MISLIKRRATLFIEKTHLFQYSIYTKLSDKYIQWSGDKSHLPEGKVSHVIESYKIYECGYKKFFEEYSGNKKLHVIPHIVPLLNKSILDIASILYCQYENLESTHYAFERYNHLFCHYNIYHENYANINEPSDYLSYTWHFHRKFKNNNIILYYLNILKKINSINEINVEPIPKYYWSFDDDKIFTKKLVGDNYKLYKKDTNHTSLWLPLDADIESFDSQNEIYVYDDYIGFDLIENNDELTEDKKNTIIKYYTKMKRTELMS
jgi:hypothetical protein